MNWKILLLLVVAIVLIASGIMLYVIYKPGKLFKPVIGKESIVLSLNQPNTTHTMTFTVTCFQPLPPPPLYARLWFVPLIVGIAILGFLGFKRFKL